MKTDILKIVFNAQRVEMGFEDGKQVKIYYTKNDYISVGVDECITDKEIERKVLKEEKQIKAIIALVSHMKKKKSLGFIIGQCINERLGIETGFQIKINDTIEIICMGRTFTVPMHPIGEITEPVVEAVLYGEVASGANKVKAIKQNIIPTVINTFKNEIRDIMMGQLAQTKEWRSFEDGIKTAYIACEEFKSEIKKYGFLFADNCRELSLAESISETLDLSCFEIIHKDNKTFFSNKGELFCLQSKKTDIFYDLAALDKAVCGMNGIQTVLYDIYREIMPYSPKNICFEITEDGSMCVHTRGGCIKDGGCREVYRFISSVKGYMGAKRTTEEEMKVDYLSSVKAGCIRKCMESFGKIGCNELAKVYVCCGLGKEATEEAVRIMPEILMAMKRMGFVKNWHINGDGTYNADFIESELYLHECLENTGNLELRKTYRFENILNMFTKDQVSMILKDRDYVRKNTKDIILNMDESRFTNGHEEEICRLLPDLDEKFYPLLRMQVLKRDSEKILGTNIAGNIRRFLQDPDDYKCHIRRQQQGQV